MPDSQGTCTIQAESACTGKQNRTICKFEMPAGEASPARFDDNTSARIDTVIDIKDYRFSVAYANIVAAFGCSG